ncbi:hypothetical protein EVAR_8159_1 [Eumeta japonica]|uniref:Uncharacterized protein n=1 Tax=Eumeta variegata TaxID=151549 RepID=A0A4C1TTF0_EUMVA|nr:hypothetical protein EVAR_8159_1 [Eumeta japonica]
MSFRTVIVVVGTVTVRRRRTARYRAGACSLALVIEMGEIRKVREPGEVATPVGRSARRRGHAGLDSKKSHAARDEAAGATRDEWSTAGGGRTTGGQRARSPSYLNRLPDKLLAVSVRAGRRGHLGAGYLESPVLPNAAMS